MSRFENVDGSLLTLGAVAALAAVGVARRGSFNDDEWAEPDQDTLDQEAVIHDPAWGKVTLSVEGKLIGQYDDVDDAMGALRVWMDENQFWPAIYWVNERGNTDLVDIDGNILASWV